MSLCDGFGAVEGSWLEGGGEGGELAVAFDPAVLLFGGEEPGGGPAEAHVRGSFAVAAAIGVPVLHVAGV